MPRIFASDNSPIDFCRPCFPTKEEAAQRYGDIGDGPDGRGNCFGYDDEHPDYTLDPHHCADCNVKLRKADH